MSEERKTNWDFMLQTTAIDLMQENSKLARQVGFLEGVLYGAIGLPKEEITDALERGITRYEEILGR